MMQSALHWANVYMSTDGNTTNLSDASWLTPLLTLLKDDFAIWNPKNSLFLIQERLLVLIFFPSEWLIYNYL